MEPLPLYSDQTKLYFHQTFSFFEGKLYVTASKDENDQISTSEQELNRSSKQIGITSYSKWLGKILSIITHNVTKIEEAGQIYYVNTKDYNHWLRKAETLGSIDQITFTNLKEMELETLAKVKAVYPNQKSISKDLIISINDRTLEERSIEKQNRAEQREYVADSMLLKELQKLVQQKTLNRGILFVEQEDIVNEVLDLLDELEKIENDHDKIEKLESFVQGRSIFSSWHLNAPCGIPERILLAGGPRAVKIIRELSEAGKDNDTYKEFIGSIDGMINHFLRNKTNCSPENLFNLIAPKYIEGKTHLQLSEVVSPNTEETTSLSYEAADSILLSELKNHVIESAWKRGVGPYKEQPHIEKEVNELLTKLENTKNNHDKIEKLESFIRGTSAFSSWRLNAPCDIQERILLVGGPRALKIIRELNQAGLKNDYTIAKFNAVIDNTIISFLREKAPNFSSVKLFFWIATHFNLEKEGKIYFHISERLPPT